MSVAMKTRLDGGSLTGGEAGIRTLDTAFRPYNGLANRRLQPLGHLTARLQVYGTKDTYVAALTAKRRRRPPFRPLPLTLNATTSVLCIVGTPLVLGTPFG